MLIVSSKFADCLWAAEAARAHIGDDDRCDAVESGAAGQPKPKFDLLDHLRRRIIKSKSEILLRCAKVLLFCRHQV